MKLYKCNSVGKSGDDCKECSHSIGHECNEDCDSDCGFIEGSHCIEYVETSEHELVEELIKRLKHIVRSENDGYVDLFKNGQIVLAKNILKLLKKEND